MHYKWIILSWPLPCLMGSWKDSTPGQSLTPLATTVTAICRLPVPSVPSVTCLWTSVAFPLLTILCPWSWFHAIPNVIHLSTQRPGPGTTCASGRPRCDSSAQQLGISPGSSASRRQTSMPRFCLHPAATLVLLKIERINSLSVMAGSAVISPTTISTIKLPRSCHSY